MHIGDLLPIQGSYPSQTAYLTPGLEATGVVEAVGPDTPVSPGDTAGARVSFFPHAGAWSEYVLVPAEFVVPVSDDVPDSIGYTSQAAVRVAPQPAHRTRGTGRPPWATWSLIGMEPRTSLRRSLAPLVTATRSTGPGGAHRSASAATMRRRLAHCC
ncbi:alcohol dehydrogenase catalytic domain-containing protein [Nonomuraea sp. NPDC050451]|uniref:alcohol dehydrogenase catalytic domain-containing protein n=1 Tax=Nonomuraea sp. NPDC050451 TaxID=3364364 RepID=UPI00379BC770